MLDRGILGKSEVALGQQYNHINVQVLERFPSMDPLVILNMKVKFLLSLIYYYAVDTRL
jgi:hypothetical protein